MKNPTIYQQVLDLVKDGLSTKDALKVLDANYKIFRKSLTPIQRVELKYAKYLGLEKIVITKAFNPSSDAKFDCTYGRLHNPIMELYKAPEPLTNLDIELLSRHTYIPL